MKRMILTAVALSAAVALGGCKNGQGTTTMPSSASMGMLNSTCPMSGEPVSADSTVEYKGNKIGFCCNGCKAPWVGQTEAEKAQYVADQMGSR